MTMFLLMRLDMARGFFNIRLPMIWHQTNNLQIFPRSCRKLIHALIYLCRLKLYYTNQLRGGMRKSGG